MKNVPFIGCILMFSTVATAQKIAVDSKGKSVFSYTSLSDFRLEFSSEEPLSLGTSFWRYTHPYHYANDTTRTVLKTSGVIANLSVLNSGELPAFTDLSKLRPGIGFTLGYQERVDSIFNLTRTMGTFSWGINGILNIDNVKLFNSADSTISKVHPVTYGVELNFVHFPKSSRFLIAANASWTKTWNDAELLNYQNRSDVTIRNTVVALEEFDGRYGVLDRKVTKFRVAASIPIYFGVFNPIPYAVMVSSSGNMPQYFIGSFMNLLSAPVTGRQYTTPSSAGVGFDWTYSGDKKWSGINVFIKGTLSIGSF